MRLLCSQLKQQKCTMGTDSFKFKAFTHWHIGCIYQIWTCEWTCLMGSYGNWKPQCRTHCLSRLSEGYRYVHEPWTMNHEPWYSLFERSAIKTCSGVREWGKRVGSHVAVNTNYVHIGRYLQCLETSDSGRYTYLPTYQSVAPDCARHPDGQWQV